MSDKSPFTIASDTQTGEAVSAPSTGDLADRIKGLITSSDVFLFMKGNPSMPQCGFSANTVAMLNALDVEFKTFDILSDMEIRQGVKDFSNWPTYPQLYFKGELLGGNDIITEMYHSGDLQTTLK